MHTQERRDEEAKASYPRLTEQSFSTELLVFRKCNGCCLTRYSFQVGRSGDYAVAAFAAFGSTVGSPMRSRSTPVVSVRKSQSYNSAEQRSNDQPIQQPARANRGQQDVEQEGDCISLRARMVVGNGMKFTAPRYFAPPPLSVAMHQSRNLLMAAPLAGSAACRRQSRTRS